MVFRGISVIAISLFAMNGCGLTQLGPSQRHHFEHSALNFEFTSTYPRSREPLELLEAFLPGTAPETRIASTPAVAPRRVSNTHRTPRRHPAGIEPGYEARTAPVTLASAPPQEEESLDDILGPPVPPLATLAPTVMSAVLRPVSEERAEGVGTSVAEAAVEADATEVIASPAPEPAPAAPAAPLAVVEVVEVVEVEKSTDSRRMEIAEAARRLVGVQEDFTSETLLQHVLRVNGVNLKNAGSRAFTREFFRSLRNQGLSYDTERPSVGDIVFFHNTRDVNSDGRNNDWYSATGVITDVSPAGTVTFVSVVNAEVRKLVMNLGRPEVRRDEAEQSVLNSYLRSRKMSDPDYTQYLAGELFAGYASVALP